MTEFSFILIDFWLRVPVELEAESRQLGAGFLCPEKLLQCSAVIAKSGIIQQRRTAKPSRTGWS
jgi:hypothetical protein